MIDPQNQKELGYARLPIPNGYVTTGNSSHRVV